jgi:hypothetical protein
MIPMAIFGVGLGFNMQPVILAVQNAVDPREMGVATASVTFFRQMGGTLGAAVFLSILFSTVTANITSAVGDVARTDAFRAAAAANPDDVALLRSGAASLDDTSFINRIDPTLAHPFQVGFSESTGLVFLIAAGIIMIGLVVVAFLPDVPLRNVSGVQARQADAEALAVGDSMPTDSHPGKGSLDGERSQRAESPGRPV